MDAAPCLSRRDKAGTTFRGLTDEGIFLCGFECHGRGVMLSDSEVAGSLLICLGFLAASPALDGDGGTVFGD